MGYDPSGTLDWSAIGRFLGGIALAILGGVITLASLPIALVGGGGVGTQLGFSTMMYSGYMVASVFDSTIKSDMDCIGWNPFNSNESLVYNSSKVSFYKGMPAMCVNHSSGRSASFLGIWLSGTVNADDVKHERGHGSQQAIMGWLKYFVMIGIPSAKEWGG